MVKFYSFALLLMALSPQGIARETIYYPRQGPSADLHSEYPIKLLQMALQKSGKQYTLMPSIDTLPNMLQGRALKEIESGRGNVHIVWSVTSKEREQRVMPIRIPIDKGLLGWRLPLVMKQHADEFINVKDLAGMQQFISGQGHDWPDTDILRANGLPVQTAPNFESLFLMLEAGRFNYFPRSITEIWREAGQHSTQGMVVAHSIILHYPSAYYYFVNKNHTTLARDLSKGLEVAIADGSFEKLFHQYHDEALKLADLKKRTVIELKNPLLPSETPLQRKELWFQPK